MLHERSACLSDLCIQIRGMGIFYNNYYYLIKERGKQNEVFNI